MESGAKGCEVCLKLFLAIATIAQFCSRSENKALYWILFDFIFHICR